MRKTLALIAAATALPLMCGTALAAEANPFTDVPRDHWAYDAIEQLAADNVIEGYGDGTYRGDRAITRYEMAQMVAKAMSKSVSGTDKALLNKLAAEFSAELNNLGVKVAELERNADQVKWEGMLRWRHQSQWQSMSRVQSLKAFLQSQRKPSASSSTTRAPIPKMQAPTASLPPTGSWATMPSSPPPTTLCPTA